MEKLKKISEHLLFKLTVVIILGVALGYFGGMIFDMLGVLPSPH